MIFYFSGTGNSKYVATRIAAETNDKIIDMAQVLKSGSFNFKVETGEKVGFVFPVYSYGVPTVVSDFVKKLDLDFDAKEEPYSFLIITCGGSIANASGLFIKMLQESNSLVPNAVYSHLMPDNYIPMYNVPTAEQSKDRLEKGNQILENEIIPTIKEEKRHELKPSVLDVLQTAVMYPAYTMLRGTKSFYATDACTSCGLCEQICPTDSIEIQNGKPVWVKKQCTKCLACIHRCPARAIQHGKGTEKRNRYVHPECK